MIKLDIKNWEQLQKNQLLAILDLYLFENGVKHNGIKVSGLDTEAATIEIVFDGNNFDFSQDNIESFYATKISEIETKDAQEIAVREQAQKNTLEAKALAAQITEDI